MARKIGFFDRWFMPEIAEISAINANADAVEALEANVGTLQATIANQKQQILELRATIIGLVEVLHVKLGLDEGELEYAVRSVWTQLTKPPEPPPEPHLGTTDPYRNLPGAEILEDSEWAKRLLRIAENHVEGQRLVDARRTYERIVEQYGDTKQGALARKQLEELWPR